MCTLHITIHIVLYFTIIYNTLKYNIVLYYTIMYNTLQWNIAFYWTILYNILQYNSVNNPSLAGRLKSDWNPLKSTEIPLVYCISVQYSTVLYSTLQYSTVYIGRILIFGSRLLLVSCPRFDNIEIWLSEVLF